MQTKINSFVPIALFLEAAKTSENHKGRERVHWEQLG